MNGWTIETYDGSHWRELVPQREFEIKTLISGHVDLYVDGSLMPVPWRATSPEGEVRYIEDPYGQVTGK